MGRPMSAENIELEITIDEKGNIVSMTIEHARIVPDFGNSLIKRCPAKLHRNAEHFI